MRFSGTMAALLAFGSWGLLARAEPNVIPAKPSRAEAPKPSPSCTAPTMQGSEQGEPIGSACVANTPCVRACGQAVGEAIAAAHEPQDEVCKGNPDCEHNESSLRINTANLQTSYFVGCLWLCWAPKKSGECRSDLDCVPSNPCAGGWCREGTCSEVKRYDGTRCADANGVVGACETGQCLDPDRYLSTCGPYVAKGADMDWGMYAEDAVRCRNDVSCDRRSLNGFRRNLSLALMECVSTALDLGADPRGK